MREPCESLVTIENPSLECPERAAPEPTLIFVWVLSLAQFAWGALLAVCTRFPEVERELGLNKVSLILRGVSPLVIAELLSVPVGIWLGRNGGHLISTAGSVFADLSLGLLSIARDYAVWLWFGATMSASLMKPGSQWLIHPVSHDL